MWKIVFWEHECSKSEVTGNGECVRHLVNYIAEVDAVRYIVYDDTGAEFIRDTGDRLCPKCFAVAVPLVDIDNTEGFDHDGSNYGCVHCKHTFW